MASTTLAQLARGVAAAPAAAEQALRESGRLLEQLSVAGAKAGMAAGVSPDGTPYPPLRHPRPNGGALPLRDQGLLAASISSQFGADAVLSLRANAPGARLHQEGGDVRPVRGQFLTIPLTAEAKRAGGARAFPRRLFRVGMALAERAGQAAGLVFHYALSRGVTVTKRTYLGWSAETLRTMGEAVADRAAAIWARGIVGRH